MKGEEMKYMDTLLGFSGITVAMTAKFFFNFGENYGLSCQKDVTTQFECLNFFRGTGVWSVTFLYATNHIWKFKCVWDYGGARCLNANCKRSTLLWNTWETARINNRTLNKFEITNVVEILMYKNRSVTKHNRTAEAYLILPHGGRVGLIIWSLSCWYWC